MARFVRQGVRLDGKVRPEDDAGRGRRNRQDSRKPNPAYDSVRHAFHSVKSDPLVYLVARTFSLLRPDSFSYTVSIARYGEGHHIVRHDDRAYADVMVDGGDWYDDLGGNLLDLQVDPPARLVPEFHSVVAFRIPRWHEVLLVKGPRLRYSVFGWFLGEVGDANAAEETKRLSLQTAKYDSHPPSTNSRTSQHGKKRSNGSSDVSAGGEHPLQGTRPAKKLRDVGPSSKVAGMRGEFKVDDIS
ncbi:hypothetical protein M427DRAFT_145752 [Gonapodya prolifera JEL478]|uniref:Uncharacterized protein n=1 Tax=Gonapodya prolifera (strain JEL478) TaxID=1344416 RepID=A0A139AEW7_GONPJ|nr:hypothetical protein M427DRAFT_145752 [Gonapodya prolifera JEL478]|eukprot:KXS14975.1 hypothetical protein M427DRAFT_145752 [Gonapodya prolifera JEL478]